MVYSVVVFRRKPGETGDGDHFEGHTGLEVVWTIVPLGIVLYFSFIGAQALAETMRSDPQAMEVKVTAFQWGWRYEYPAYGVTSTTLNIPINRQVLLKLTSTDVIHSFWVPEFRVKQDALPGEDMIKELRITPTQLGEFKVRCAELCGAAHAYMEGPVVVMEQAAFDAWIAEQSRVSNDPVERGKKLATQSGCIGCHTTDGRVVVGPTWQGLFGSQRTIADGTTVTADEAYLKDSIVSPNAQIVQGFTPNIMPPNYGQTLSEAQLNDLIAYIRSVK
jgi:cytochrome c oxidase subunit 2